MSLMMALMLMVNVLMKPQWLLLLSCAALQSTAEVADRFDGAPGACPPAVLLYRPRQRQLQLLLRKVLTSAPLARTFCSVTYGYGGWCWCSSLRRSSSSFFLPPSSFTFLSRRIPTNEAWTNGTFRSRPPTSPPVVRVFIHVHQLFTFRTTLHFEVGVRPPNLNRHFGHIKVEGP